MSDQKISALGTATIVDTDLLAVVHDPGGSPATVKATIAAVLALGGGGGGGGLALLEQHTASGSSSLDFTTALSALYDDYLIEFVNVKLATNNTGLQLLCSTDGGSTWDTSAIYDAIFNYVSTNNSSGANGTTGNAFCDLNGNCDNTGAVNVGGLNGSMHLHDPLSATDHKTLHGHVNYPHTSIGRIFVRRGFVYRNTAAVTALRFIPASGNIASGKIRIYGLAK